MPNCGTRNKTETGEPGCYSLKALAANATPQNFNQLEDWLTGKEKQPVWDGKTVRRLDNLLEQQHARILTNWLQP